MLFFFFACTLFCVCFAVESISFKPVKGTGYDIFSPHAEKNRYKEISNDQAVFSGPNAWLQYLNKFYKFLDGVSIPDQKDNIKGSSRPKEAYLELLKSLLLGSAFKKMERSVRCSLAKSKGEVVANDYNSARSVGTDWPYLGITMTGEVRLDILKNLLEDIISKKIPGVFLEAGVWRGGTVAYAKAIFIVNGQADRPVISCDSYSGLPPGNPEYYANDLGWDGVPYLSVHDEFVASSLNHYGLLDDKVYFAKGYFNDTMPHLKKQVNTISILRLDGDIYQSTVDVLYHLYDKVSIGGYVIIDDFYGFPARGAVEDFVSAHSLSKEVVFVKIDQFSIYWEKKSNPEIQYWRYEKKQFK